MTPLTAPRATAGPMIARALALGCLLGLLGAAGAAAARPGGSLVSFRDANKVPLESQLTQLLPVMKLGCAGGSVAAARRAQVPLPPGVELPPGFELPTVPGKPAKRKRVRPAVALRRARALAGKGAAGRVMRRLRSQLRSEGDARGLAVAATIGRSPRLVLGGMLAANAKDPRDAMNLVNLATPLVMLGKPNEALAVLDRAAALGGRAKRAGAAAAGRGLASVLGVPGRAVLENNRGAAMLKLGRYKDAESALRRAVAAGGRTLAEAHANLGLAQLCQGKNSAAVASIRLSYARQAVTYLAPASIATGGRRIGEYDLPLAAEAYELRAGTDGVLPDFVTPSSPEQGIAQRAAIAALQSASNARASQLTDRR